jgi:hypothetical protein
MFANPGIRSCCSITLKMTWRPPQRLRSHLAGLLFALVQDPDVRQCYKC